MTETPIFIFRVRPDGVIEQPDCWHIINDGDYIHRVPGETDEQLRARTIDAAPPGPQIILHSKGPK